jgi:phage N-6-adenine-methyltransferase
MTTSNRNQIRNDSQYTTPRWLFEQWDARYHFDLDAAASKANALCSAFFTADVDALTQPWHGSVWCNPPYRRGMISRFCAKAVDEVLSGRSDVVVMLLPSDTSTSWFHDHVYAQSTITYIRGRVAFGGTTKSPTFGSLVAVFSPSSVRNDPATVTADACITAPIRGGAHTGTTEPNAVDQTGSASEGESDESSELTSGAVRPAVCPAEASTGSKSASSLLATSTASADGVQLSAFDTRVAVAIAAGTGAAARPGHGNGGIASGSTDCSNTADKPLALQAGRGDRPALATHVVTIASRTRSQQQKRRRTHVTPLVEHIQASRSVVHSP